MTKWVYQYHAYNDHISIIVSVPVENQEYAVNFAKRVAFDFYDHTEDQLVDVKCDFIVKFWMESAINLNKLSNNK